MSDKLVFRFDVQGDDFTSAGQASVQVKKNLRQLGFDTEVIKRVLRENESTYFGKLFRFIF